MISKNQMKLVRSLELKKNRRREGLFVAEGPKVVGDLLRAGFTPHSIFCTQIGSWLPTASQVGKSTSQGDKSTDPSDKPVIVTDEELRRISFLQHPQEVLALFHMPYATASSPGSPESDMGCNILNTELALALDGVQDPGNLGTIIRIADWFGIKTIYCSPDTADAFNPKVVQATMGSIAHVHIYYCDLVALLSQVSCPVYGTLLDGDNIYQQTLTPNGIIVMGNEGNGISDGVRPLVTNRLLIPNFNADSNTAESLNVAIATAITCSEFRRR